jgi:mannan endo-1,4-beta-mannosidase
MLHRLRNSAPNPRLRMSGLRITVFALLLAAPASVNVANPPPTAFVNTSGTEFTVDGKTLFVTGVNNRHLTFGSHNEVTRVLDDAAAMDANVVRTFLQPVIRSLDGSVPTIWNWRSQADANVIRFANAWVLATEQQGEERSA